MAENTRALVRKADQKVKGGFLSCLAGNARFEEARELYQLAANQLKLQKDYSEAANCYVQCAYCANKVGSTSEEAEYYSHAGTVLAKVSTKEALLHWECAVSLLQSGELAKFAQAGKLLVKMAELVESERIDGREVQEYYKRAADMFDLVDNEKSNYSKCRLKIAEYAALNGELKEAIQIFEREGENALKNTLLQFGAKEHFLKAGLLYLQEGDSVTASNAVERYCDLDPKFGGSREGELLKGLADAFEANDPDAFLQCLHTYDAVTPLDSWKTNVLLKVKAALDPAVAGVDEVDLT